MDGAMVLSIALIFSIGTFGNINSGRLVKKILLIATLLILVQSCRMPSNFGFYQPAFLDMEAPDGTPEFKAGWRDGCRSGVATGPFVNSAVYRSKAGPTFTGIYQHSGDYKNGWGSAFWACYGYVAHLVMEQKPFGPYALE